MKLKIASQRHEKQIKPHKYGAGREDCREIGKC